MNNEESKKQFWEISNEERLFEHSKVLEQQLAAFKENFKKAESLLSSKDAEIQDLTEYKETHQLQSKYVAELEEKWADQKKEIQQLKDELQLRTMQAKDFCQWDEEKKREIQQLKEERDGLKEELAEITQGSLYDTPNRLKLKGVTREQIAEAINWQLYTKWAKGRGLILEY